MATARAQEISCCSVSCSVTPAFQHRRLRHCNATRALTKMRQWVASMHERFSYPHLYSGSKFEPYYPRPAAADPLQRGVFYLSLLTMFVLFPVTVPLVFALMRKGTARRYLTSTAPFTAAVLDALVRLRYWEGGFTKPAFKAASEIHR